MYNVNKFDVFWRRTFTPNDLPVEKAWPE